MYMTADWREELHHSSGPTGSSLCASCQRQLLLPLLHQAIRLPSSDGFEMALLLYMDVVDPWWQTPGLLETNMSVIGH